MIDSAYDHYVSVAYFSEEGSFEKSKVEWYTKKDAEKMFATVTKKYKGNDQKVFIQLRDRVHNLINSERNFGWEKRGTKEKSASAKLKEKNIRETKVKGNRSKNQEAQ